MFGANPLWDWSQAPAYVRNTTMPLRCSLFVPGLALSFIPPSYQELTLNVFMSGLCHPEDASQSTVLRNL